MGAKESPRPFAGKRGDRSGNLGQDVPGAVAGSKGIESSESSVHSAPTHATIAGMTVEYLSLQGVADHLGVSRNTVAKLRLPEPDVVVGADLNARRGWSVATIDEWNAKRPGPGNWGPRVVAESKGKK